MNRFQQLRDIGVPVTRGMIVRRKTTGEYGTIVTPRRPWKEPLAVRLNLKDKTEPTVPGEQPGETIWCKPYELDYLVRFTTGTPLRVMFRWQDYQSQDLPFLWLYPRDKPVQEPAHVKLESEPRKSLKSQFDQAISFDSRKGRLPRRIVTKGIQAKRETCLLSFLPSTSGDSQHTEELSREEAQALRDMLDIYLAGGLHA